MFLSWKLLLWISLGIEMLVYSISPPSLNLIGALTTEICYRTEKSRNTHTRFVSDHLILAASKYKFKRSKAKQSMIFYRPSRPLRHGGSRGTSVHDGPEVLDDHRHNEFPISKELYSSILQLWFWYLLSPFFLNQWLINNMYIFWNSTLMCLPPPPFFFQEHFWYHTSLYLSWGLCRSS